MVVSGSPVALTEGGAPGAYTVVLNTDPGQAVTVTPTSGDAGAVTVSGALSFTGGASGNWDEPQTVTVTPVDDADFDDESVTITHAVSGYPGVTSAPSATVTVADDDATPVVSVTGGAAVAEGGSASFTVSASPAPAAAITVSLTVAESGGYVDSDDTGAATVTIGAGASSATFTVATAGDDVDGQSGSVTVTVAAGTGYEVSDTASSASVSVTDDDATTVVLAVTDATASEGDDDETATLTVTLGRALVSGESLTAPLSFAGGAAGTEFSLSLTAATGVSFAADTSTLTFTGSAAGSATTATLTLTALSDADSADETVTVSLGTLGAGALAGGATGSRTGDGEITITDASEEVTEPLVVNLSVSVDEAAEGGAITVTATLSEPQDMDVRVPIVLTPGTAEDDDFSGDRFIVIRAGSIRGSAVFQLREDQDSDDETFTVSLGDLPGSLSAGEETSVDITIEDNDPPAPDVDYAARWWDSLNAMQKTAAVYGGEASDEQAAAAGQPYAGLPGATKLLVNEAARALYDDGMFEHVGEWWESLDCRLRRIAVGDGNQADASSAWCAGYPRSGAAKVLDGSQATFVDKVGQALLGLDDPGVYPVVTDLAYAMRWWDALGAGQRVAAVYGDTFTERQAAAASQVYEDLDGVRKFRANEAARSLYGDGAFDSVGAWWQSLDCRQRRVAVGDGNQADASSAWCADYPGSGASSVLSGSRKAFVDKVGQALLDRADPGIYPVAGLSVADARAQEGPGAMLTFVVSLDKATTVPVTLNWATANGTATAGADYVAGSGALRFAPGETEKSVDVAVLEDAVDEGDETLLLRLSSVSGARLVDGEAEGTIENLLPAPSEWLAQFGRVAAEQVMQGVSDRLTARRNAAYAAQASRASGSGVNFEGHLAGWNSLFGGLPDEDSGLSGAPSAALGASPLLSHGWSSPFGGASRAWAGGLSSGYGNGAPSAGYDDASSATGGFPSGTAGRSPSADGAETGLSSGDLLRSVVAGSSFAAGGAGASGRQWGVWGRGAHTTFESAAAGMSLEGDVTTGQLGLDLSGSGWLVGLSVSHSMGEGDYTRAGGGGEGQIESTLTAVTPYAGLGTDRFWVWGAGSVGEGDLTLNPQRGAGAETDIETDMAAVGLRGELLKPGSGFGLSVLSDALMVQSTSEAVPGLLPAADVESTRVRLALEASWTRATQNGGLFQVSLEAGGRQDDGDAGEGMGAEVAGALSWTSGGLTFELEGRSLVSHEDEEFKQTGASAYLSWDSTPGSAQGPAVSLRQRWGIVTDSGLDQMFAMKDMGDFGLQTGMQSLNAEFSWGRPMFGERFMGIPYLTYGVQPGGREQTFGWQLEPAGKDGLGGLDLSFNFKAVRRVTVNAPEYGVLIESRLRW